MPPIHEVLKDDGKLRTMFVLYDDFEVGFDPRLIWEDLKADFDIVGKHRNNVERSAIVTNIDWLRRWMKLGGWIAPGRHEAVQARRDGRGEGLGRRLGSGLQRAWGASSGSFIERRIS